jgi:hypothetical protein
LQTTLATTCVVTATRTADAFTAQTSSDPTNIVISGTPLTPPTITGVTAVNTTQLTVTFTSSANTTSTNAYLYSASTGGSALQSLTNQSSGFTFTNLNPSTTYYVSLLAVGTGNYANSAESARTSGTTLAVATAPLVSVNPSSTTIYLGQSVTFNATASSSDGGSLSYQWSFGGSSISAATSAQYLFTPTLLNQSGTYLVTVTNSRNGTTSTATATGALTILGVLSMTTPTSGLSGTSNAAFSLALLTSGGQTPLAFTLTSGALPTGLNLNSSSGLISGTPTTTGSFAITVTATDANSQTSAATFTLQINPATQVSSFAIVPRFSEPQKTSDGFIVSVTNYDPTFTMTAEVSKGSITNSIPVGSNWILVITGLSPGQSATLTVETSRTGYVSQSAFIISQALEVIRIDPMLPVTKPVVTFNDGMIMCTIGTYSQIATSAVFSLFVDGKHISTNFSAIGERLPDWIMPWTSSSTVTRTATLSSSSWAMSDAYKGKSVTCTTLAYSKHATGMITSAVATAP